MALLQPPNNSDNNPIVIDLREYLLALIQRWRLIAALAVIALIVAIAVTLLIPKTYTAETNFSIPFNATIRDNSRQHGILALAKSQPLLTNVYNTIQADLIDPQNFSALNEATFVRFDGLVLTFAVTWSNASDAAFITDRWATEVSRIASETELAEGTPSVTEEKRAAAITAYEIWEMEHDTLDTFMLESDLLAKQQELSTTLSLIDHLSEQATFVVDNELLDDVSAVVDEETGLQIRQLTNHATELQKQLWVLERERVRLETERNTAWRVYVNFDQEARRLEIEGEEESPEMDVVLAAEPPLEPNESNVVSTAVIAGVVGALGGVFVIWVDVFRKSFATAKQTGVSA